MSKTRITVETSTKAWLRRGQRASDRDKAIAAAPRVARFLIIWEMLKERSGAWMSLHEIADHLDINDRLVRRTFYTLEATGFVEVDRPTSAEHRPSRIRIKSAQ